MNKKNPEYVMKKATLLIERDQIALMQKRVDNGEFRNISEAYRAAIRTNNQYGDIIKQLDAMQKMAEEYGLNSPSDFIDYISELKQANKNISGDNRELLDELDRKDDEIMRLHKDAELELELLGVYRKLEAEREKKKCECSDRENQA